MSDVHILYGGVAGEVGETYRYFIILHLSGS